MGGLDRGELFDATRLTPFGEATGGIQVRLAGVIVVELGGEEFEEAPGGLRRRGEERSGNTGGAGMRSWVMIRRSARSNRTLVKNFLG